jgi:hypothetical protein
MTVDVCDYLLKASPEEVQQTWHALGEFNVSNDTKLYTKGAVVRVKTGKHGVTDLEDRFIYVLEEYRVNNKTLFCIDWEDMNADDIDGIFVAIQGIRLSYFAVLPGKWSASIHYDPAFLPYSNIKEDDVYPDGIDIPDIELETLCTEIGFPFLHFQDIEYSKRQIIQYMVRPALQRYYTYRPIIEEEAFGNVNIGTQFKIPLPKWAYRAIPFYTTPGGYSNMGSGSPFAFYNEQAIFGGGISGGLGGGRFGKPLRYNKPVPGYAGIDENNSFLSTLAARQGYLNFFRREKYKLTTDRDSGIQYITGFTTIGGILNVKWLMIDPVWTHIPMDELVQFVRPMCKSEILKNFGMLRSLVKQDIAGQLDPQVLKEMRTEIEEDLKPMLKSIGLTGSLAIMRGGG